MTFRFVINNILSKPLRNALVVVSCTLSIILMLMMISIYKQVDKQYTDSNTDYNIVIGAKGSKTDLVLDTIFFNGIPENTIDYEVYEKIVADMQSATPHFNSAFPIAMGDNVGGYPLVGILPEYLSKYRITGNSFGEFDEEAPAAIIGYNVAKSGYKIGDHFAASHSHSISDEYLEDEHHASFRYDVIGVLEKTDTAFDNAVFCDIKAVWAVHSHEEEHQEDEEHEHQEGPLSAIIALAIGGNYQYVLNDFAASNPEVMVVSIGETLSSVMNLFGSAGGIVMAVIVIVIIMSFNMLFLAMFTSANERKRDVAILRALGSNRQKILLTILLEAVVIMALSSIIGYLLSFAGLAIVGGIFSNMMGIALSPTFVCIEQLYIIIGGFAVAMIATLIPALTVYKTEPSKYLR